MNAFVGLPANLAIDPSAMSHGIATGKGLRELRRITEVERNESRAGQDTCVKVTFVPAASDEDSLMAASRQQSSEVASDESRAAGDGNFHRVPFPNAAMA